MKKLQFLLLSCILTFAISCGQQKRYVSYKVKENETMRDIANRLDVKTKDLLRLNPDAGRKPLANTIIIIPNPELKNSNSSLNKKPYKTVSDINVTIPEGQVIDSIKTNEKVTFQQTVYEYETHTVKAGETVYRITKLYNISKDDLIKWNPEFPGIKDNYLNVGQTLKVKSEEKVIIINKEDVLKNFLTHTVKSKETIYSLTRFYNVSKNNLIELNPEFPEIKNDELSIGMLLKIKPFEKVNKDINYTFYKDSIAEESTINLAVLLPFKANEFSNSKANDIFKNNRLANMVTDFYMGLEIAVDSIKKQGIDVNINVFDTGDRGNKTSMIISDNKLNDKDLIIGPFYHDKAKEVSKSVNSPIIFPHFSKKQDKFYSDKIIKSSPDKNNYTDYLTSYLKENYRGEEIFVVGDGETDSNKKIEKIINTLKQHDSINEINILKPEKGYIKSELFSEKMIAEKYNWVIITSNNYVTISDVINSMIGLPDDITIKVFAIEKDVSYNKIENNKLASINFSYVSTNYEDLNLTEVKVFNKKYIDKNHTIPSDYAIRGFDVTYDALIRLASGKGLTETFKEGVSYRVENKFDYTKKPYQSYSNNGLFIIQYNKDLSLSRLK